MMTIDAKAEKLECLLRTIVRAIARNGQVPVITHLEQKALFELRVDPLDHGRIVGKQGIHIWAIQTLFWFAGMAQLGYSYSVRLLEPIESGKGHSSPFRFNPKWDKEAIKTLIAKILEVCIPGHASCELKEDTPTSATAHLKLQKYLQMVLSDPSFTEAFSVLIRAAGMSHGANVTTAVSFA